MTDELTDYVIKTASGDGTKNEKNGCCEISIFKDGSSIMSIINDNSMLQNKTAKDLYNNYAKTLLIYS